MAELPPQQPRHPAPAQPEPLHGLDLEEELGDGVEGGGPDPVVVVVDADQVGHAEVLHLSPGLVDIHRRGAEGHALNLGGGGKLLGTLPLTRRRQCITLPD